MYANNSLYFVGNLVTEIYFHQKLSSTYMCGTPPRVCNS